MTEAVPLVLLAGLGGGLGGVARFWVSGVVARHIGETFPWGTLTVNVTGAAAIGVLAALLSDAWASVGGTGALWAALGSGVLGSYTTVSSFSLQTLALVRNGEPLRAAFNIAGSLVLCLAAAAGGYRATLALLGGA